MRVIILAAGQGKRLLPLTAEVPKALLDIHGRTLIARQIDAFAACGLKDFVVVTGYGTSRMEEALAELAKAKGIAIRTVYNPFYAVADNLASCWMARHEMAGDFLLLNNPRKEVGELQDISARVALLWQPTDRLSILIAADANEGDNGMRPYDTLIDELGAACRANPLPPRGRSDLLL